MVKEVKFTKAKTCLVTGATGFVGLNLLEALVNDGNWNILAVSRSPRTSSCSIDRYLPAHITSQVYVVQANLESPGYLQETVQKVLHSHNLQLTAIFHLVKVKESSSHVLPGRIHAVHGLNPEGHDEHVRLNEQAMEEVIQVAESCQVERVIYCSSWSAYGIQPRGTMLEETTTLNLAYQTIPLFLFGFNRQSTGYAVAKYRCERLLQDAIQSKRIKGGVILQPASIFGKYSQVGWSGIFLRLVKTKGKLPALPGASLFCGVGQLSQAFIAAASKGSGQGEVYLMGGTNASNLQMIQTMSHLVGVHPPKWVAPTWLMMALSRWNETILSIMPLFLVPYLQIKPDTIGCPLLTAKLCQSQGTLSQKAQTVLGYKPLPLHDILRENYDWLVQEGVLPKRYAQVKKEK